MSRVRPFHNPVRIRFGDGVLSGLAELAGSRRTVILATEGMARRGALATVERSLGGSVAAVYTDIAPNPTVRSCITAFEALRGAGAHADAELIIALGGGSVIDTAKAVAAQQGSGAEAGWLEAHLRDGRPFPEPFEPPAIIAIPTTAGTGSEVTMWGTIWDEQTRGKHSISHPRLYPEAALLDPALTLSVPRPATLAAALDALSHAMEAIWNRSANPVSDAVAVRAVGIIPEALRRVLATPGDPRAREALLAASLLAGLAISNTRTALAHSISYPLTAELGLPHGIASSLTLPQILAEVGRGNPERADLIVGALGATSVAAAARGVYDLFREAETAEIVRRHIPSAAMLGDLRGGFIAPGRAENFVLPVDQAAASELLRRAYEVVCG
ncbi:MAG: iron-containing alcohol dehydrogenase [Candidatus Limnocylindria bacterium]